jgi:formylglycine-generating enzyme required for sulfatase activity
MKLFFCFGIIALFSFSAIGEQPIVLKNIKSNFVKTQKDLYVSKYEVSNLDYRLFLADLLSNKKTGIYNHCFPDTLVWKAKPQNTAPLVEFYFRHPSYDQYPVVGVSYAAALQYCDWLTEQYNQDPNRKHKKVLFKLPSKEEWIFAANKGDTSKMYTWGTGFMQNNRKQYLCNFKHTRFVFDSSTHKYNEFNDELESIILSPINAFYPNSFGLYNMCGNVAEMIEEQGIAKGGSFQEPAYQVRISSEKSYTKPQADIGFRVVMKVLED